jgi:7-carboxy-7-deazaguanine synthase
MKVAEMFYSIQGEGILTGVPSVFIRTSGCNLRCVWCDTPYTSWEPEGENLPLDRIVEYVETHTTGHVVVTGGEPMIAPEIVDFTAQLRKSGQHITIETAGTVYAPVACDLMSISPKLANSTPHERDGGRWAATHDRLRIQPSILRRLMNEYAWQLKFVVASDEDLPEVLTLIGELGARRERVLLMPEGTDPATLHARGPWLAEVCKREGFRYCPRLHIELYGNRRGT